MTFKRTLVLLMCMMVLRTALSLDNITSQKPLDRSTAKSKPAMTLTNSTSVTTAKTVTPGLATTLIPTQQTTIAKKSTQQTTIVQKSTQKTTIAQKSTQQTTVVQKSTQQTTKKSTQKTTVARTSTQQTTVEQKSTEPITTEFKKPLDIFTVINELTSNESMTNETLEYLVDVIGDPNNKYHVFLPTLLAIDPRTPIALLKKVLVHPDYSVKMLEALAKDTTLASLVLKPVFDNYTDTVDILSMIFSSEKLTLKLLEMLGAKPILAQIVVDGMLKTMHVIGNNISVVDNALEFIGNLSLSTDKLLGVLMSNPSLVDSLTPLLKEILNSPILGNYLFSKFLENKQLVENIQKVLFSSPEILETFKNFKVDPVVGQQLLGLVLQHPVFAKQLFGQILSKPEIVVKLVALVLDGTSLKDSFIGKFVIDPVNQATISNLIKFIQGRNDSGVVLPPIFVPAIIRNLLAHTQLGNLLTALNAGQIKTFQQLIGTIQGVSQNIYEVPGAIFKFVLNFLITRGNNSNNSTDTNNELVSTLYKDALHNTTIGKLLGSLGTGKVPTIVQISSLAKGFVQNLHEVPTVLKQLAESLEDNLEDPCAVDSLFSAVGLFQLESWALKFIDASGKPERSILKGNIAFMGAYDECTEISQQVTNKHGSHVIEGGYCELAFTIPQAFFNTFAKSAANIEGVSHDLRLDICLPKSCREKEIDAVLNRTMVNLLGVGLSKIHCKEDKSLKGDTGAYVALVVFGLLGFLCILGTAYDVYFSLSKVEDDDEDVPEDARGNSVKNGLAGPVVMLTKFIGSEEDGLPQVEKGGEYKIHDEIQTQHKLDSKSEEKPAEANRFLMAFSIRANAAKILNASQPKGSLTCLNGIRVISMSWIIMGHILTTFNTTVENSTEALEFIELFSFQIMLNAPLAVDTFFILSGLLVCYLFVKEIDKIGKIKFQHMFLYYFHRIWRLTPLYALVLLFYTCLSQYLASGPFDDEHPLYRENCRHYWWRNLLYVNTLFDTKEMCMFWSWYLSHDMIFYIVSPLVIVPLSLGFKKIGFFLIFCMVCIHITTYGYYEWTIGSGAQLFHNYEYMNAVYLKPWCRVGVYAMGLALGYIIFKTKLKYRFRRSLLILGWIIAAGLAIFVAYITYLEHKKEDPHWPVEYRIAHETICRPIWALCVCWVVFTCVNGQGGFINSILSWSFWVPLTKITYGAYLLHLLLIDNIMDSNMRATYYLNIFHVAFEFVGVFVFSYAFSFIFSLLIEAPCMGLEKILLKKKK